MIMIRIRIKIRGCGCGCGRIVIGFMIWFRGGN